MVWKAAEGVNPRASILLWGRRTKLSGFRDRGGTDWCHNCAENN